MTDQEMKQLLSEVKTIAVVGLSANKEKDSYKVAEYLLEHGYTVVPVNPTIDQVLGIEASPSLADLEQPVDLVDVFRKPQDALNVAQEALAAGNRKVWYQLGTITPGDAQTARDLGLSIISERCIMREHKRLFS